MSTILVGFIGTENNRRSGATQEQPIIVIETNDAA
jgi:hypothetical protein